MDFKTLELITGSWIILYFKNDFILQINRKTFKHVYEVYRKWINLFCYIGLIWKSGEWTYNIMFPQYKENVW